MIEKREDRILVEEVIIAGHSQPITLRSYLPSRRGVPLPIVLYFHGGCFVSGAPEDVGVPAIFIAHNIPAWVISVGYSLSPSFPFPAALEDGYRALKWVVSNARANGADSDRLAVAGHDAGGNIATCLAAIIRDRGEFQLSAQAILAPLIDPSMTRLVKGIGDNKIDLSVQEARDCYRAYLPKISQRLHPYAAPIESRRLANLAPTMIASAEHDIYRGEAEQYAAALIEAGVPIEMTRYANTTHQEIARHSATLYDMVRFFNRIFSDQPHSG